MRVFKEERAKSIRMRFGRVSPRTRRGEWTTTPSSRKQYSNGGNSDATLENIGNAAWRVKKLIHILAVDGWDSETCSVGSWDHNQIWAVKTRRSRGSTA